ncbi:MAG: hemerythrin family protein [Gammaproteobacteria bacterium]|nr:hemerythrin family protein [Gammaproteobacteria bacterium]
MTHDQNSRPRPLGQKISLAIAYLCYAAAVGCGLTAALYDTQGESDPVQASFMAAVVFFVGCGVVLQVIGTARLHGVLSGSGDHDPE